ncbi:MAG: tetratricopeptide repeat protein [Cyclobacteriaceae bacterium]|nr:tetratricopeptide repeat protein [Cyclobacteriaceae bacterium HetDA_MAG_MS6]
MKHIALGALVLILVGSTVVTAQKKEKKPKVGSVERLLKNGELAEAKDIIDAGILHEKTKEDGKTWYLRGLVYATIDTTSTDAKGLADNALEVAMESFAKSDELAAEGKEYYITNDLGLPVLKSQQISDYWGYYFNKGADAFGTQDCGTAVTAFETAQKINSADTNAYINAGLAAQNDEQYDAAVRNYRACIEKGAKSEDLYSLLSFVLTSKQEKHEEALAVVQSAREIYPTSNEFAKSEINLLIKLDKIEEAKTGLETAIANEPENSNLYFTLGVLYEELKDSENALINYRKSVEVDPSNYNAQFNIGVLLINSATEVIKERNNLGVSKADMKRADELEPVITKKLEMALPQWEKIYELKDDESTTLETLQYVYTQLKQYDKAEEIMKKLDSMGSSEE